jgi:hypothetical protein
MLRSRKTPLLLISGFAAFSIFALAIPSRTLAQTITVCVNKHGKVKGVNTTCSSTQTTVTWASVGPAGPAGPPGPRGASGVDAINAVLLTGGTNGPLGPYLGAQRLLNPSLTSAAPLYMPPGGAGALGGSSPTAAQEVPIGGSAGGTLGHFSASISGYPGANSGYLFAACVTPPDLSPPTCTTLCTVSNTSTKCSSTTTVPVGIGDLVTVQAYADPSAAATPSNSAAGSWSMMYTHN